MFFFVLFIFEILQAAHNTTQKQVVVPPENHDFLGVRIWQEGDRFLPGELIELNAKLLDYTEALVKSPQKEIGNAAFLVIQADYTIKHARTSKKERQYFLVPHIFLSKGTFDIENNGHLQNTFGSLQNFPQFGSWLYANQLNNTVHNQEIPYACVFKGLQLKPYKDELQAMLSSQSKKVNIWGYQHIFQNEMRPRFHLFSKHWYHSEQGIRRWLNNSSLLEQVKPYNGMKNIQYTIYIITYRDMCQRCSLSFYLDKESIKKNLSVENIKIVSIGREQFDDQLHGIQRLKDVMAIQQENIYNDSSFIYRVIG